MFLEKRKARGEVDWREKPSWNHIWPPRIEKQFAIGDREIALLNENKALSSREGVVNGLI